MRVGVQDNPAHDDVDVGSAQFDAVRVIGDEIGAASRKLDTTSRSGDRPIGTDRANEILFSV